MDKVEKNAACMAATQELQALFEIDKAHRQAAWHHRLITCLPQAIFLSGEPEILFNSSGFTYYNLELPKTIPWESSATTYLIPELIDTFLINEGVGIAIEGYDQKRSIDLSYGDILGFHLHRTFAEPDEHPFITNQPRARIIREGADLLISDVPPQILPSPSLKLLEAIMVHFGISEPKINLVYLPETEQNELIFSVNMDDSSVSKTQALIQKLGWFLPRYYSYLACDLNNLSPLIGKH